MQHIPTLSGQWMWNLLWTHWVYSRSSHDRILSHLSVILHIGEYHIHTLHCTYHIHTYMILCAISLFAHSIGEKIEGFKRSSLCGWFLTPNAKQSAFLSQSKKVRTIRLFLFYTIKRYSLNMAFSIIELSFQPEEKAGKSLECFIGFLEFQSSMSSTFRVIACSSNLFQPQ